MENEIIKTYSFSQVARILNCGLGRNKLYLVLKSNGIIGSNNAPAAEYVAKGYFQQYTKQYFTKYTKTFREDTMTLVTEDGLTWLKQFITNEVLELSVA